MLWKTNIIMKNKFHEEVSRLWPLPDRVDVLAASRFACAREAPSGVDPELAALASSFARFPPLALAPSSTSQQQVAKPYLFPCTQKMIVSPFVFWPLGGRPVALVKPGFSWPPPPRLALLAPLSKEL